MFFRKLIINRKRSTAGTFVNVSELGSDQRVIQRVGNSKLVTISGTGNGSAVRVRIVDSVTYSQITSWTTTPVNSGNWSALVNVPQGGWYLVEVTDSVNTQVSTRTSNRFGVGIIVLAAGQSNMNYLANQPHQYPLSSKYSIEYKDSVYRRLGNVNDDFPAGTISPNYSSYTTVGSLGDAMIILTNRLVSQFNCPVCIVNTAVNGSSIDSWLPAQSNFVNLNTKLNEVQDSEMCLWLQGETDAVSMNTSTYKLKLKTLQDALVSATGRQTDSFKFMVIALGQGSFNGSQPGDFGKIRIAQVEYTASTGGAYLAASNHDLATSDGVHLTEQSVSRAGKRLANTIAGYLSSQSKQGPIAQSVSRQGNLITINLQHNGGSSLVTGSGLNGNVSLTGFVVKEGSNVLTIQSYTLNTSSLVIALSSTPSTSVTVEYARVDNPHGDGNSSDLSTCVYDNQSIDDGVRGMPLVPFVMSSA
jgi:Carbohydrate esterase, sialic acid-specific acetylesterase